MRQTCKAYLEPDEVQCDAPAVDYAEIPDEEGVIRVIWMCAFHWDMYEA
jgi:hypothetical protein